MKMSKASSSMVNELHDTNEMINLQNLNQKSISGDNNAF
jgi:hypothetical protein